MHGCSDKPGLEQGELSSKYHRLEGRVDEEGRSNFQPEDSRWSIGPSEVPRTVFLRYSCVLRATYNLQHMSPMLRELVMTIRVISSPMMLIDASATGRGPATVRLPSNEIVARHARSWTLQQKCLQARECHARDHGV